MKTIMNFFLLERNLNYRLLYIQLHMNYFVIMLNTFIKDIKFKFLSVIDFVFELQFWNNSFGFNLFTSLH